MSSSSVSSSYSLSGHESVEEKQQDYKIASEEVFRLLLLDFCKASRLVTKSEISSVRALCYLNITWIKLDKFVSEHPQLASAKPSRYELLDYSKKFRQLPFSWNEYLCAKVVENLQGPD